MQVLRWVNEFVILENVGYGFNAEFEKGKLRDEYRRWKNKVKNE